MNKQPIYYTVEYKRHDADHVFNVVSRLVPKTLHERIDTTCYYASFVATTKSADDVLRAFKKAGIFVKDIDFEYGDPTDLMR